MEQRKIWIDTDTGLDDANSLICACKLENFDIVGVSTVCGNVKVEQTFENARNILHLCNRDDIKVYSGATKPLVKELETSEKYHGQNGIGDVCLEENPTEKENKVAHIALYEKAKEVQELTLVTLGPLTNIAITIANHPDVTKYIKEIVMMGGAVVGGNRTSCAEYNIYADPEAAETVFKSGVPVAMCGLDVTNKCYVTKTDLDEIEKYQTKQSDFLSQTARKFLKPSGNEETCYVIHDTAPIFYLAYPEYFTSYHCGVFVETQGTITNGKTVCDLYTDHKWEDRHVEVVMDVDHDAYVSKLKELYRG